MAASLDGFWVVSLAESTVYESVGEKAARKAANWVDHLEN